MAPTNPTEIESIVEMTKYIRLLGLILILIISVYSDISKRLIYDWVSIGGIGLGLGLCAGEALLVGDWRMLIPSVIGLVGGALIFALPCYFGWLGAGDLKLMAAVGALQGYPLSALFIFHAVFYTALVGAVMAMIILIWEGRFLSGLGGSFKLLAHPKTVPDTPEAAKTIPYGVAIALGSFWAMIIFLRAM